MEDWRSTGVVERALVFSLGVVRASRWLSISPATALPRPFDTFLFMYPGRFSAFLARRTSGYGRAFPSCRMRRT
ncbi:MAG: hypothetical protein BJ554DRAFT_180 [Olpidium bornovanus]|uniref:Uncharacterized protein n=1 Tax=Olpidium bornovanus TaxID=278681 RepID=A0A8H7ZTZ2_9FUNG|nr:MAG: hypothetical protein BJ554DRAFT_180 [Olpidium bornovanus]